MEFIGIFSASIHIGVLLARLVEQALLLDVSLHLAIGEEAAQVGIFEGIVVGERDFVDVVSVDELFLRPEGGTVAPAHA